MKRSFRIALLLTTGTLLRLFVALFILLATLISLYSQRAYIFNILEKTNTYERLPLVILNSSASQQLGQDESTQLGSEIFAPIILNATPPEVAELAAQEVVNAHYDWLEGKEDSIRFTVDLSSSKEAIIDDITTYAVSRYLLLEDCQDIVSGHDFFSVPCQILGLNLEAQEKSLTEQLENTPILLRETSYNETNLLTDASGRSLDEFAPWLIQIYKNRTLLLLATLFILLVLITVNLLGASTRVKGIRRVGKLVFQGSSGFLLTAAVLVVILPLFGLGLTGFRSEAAPLQWQNQTYDSLFNDIIAQVARDFVIRGLLFSLPFALIGSASWLYGSYQIEKQRHTGVSFATKLVKASLQSSGLVSSEKNTKKRSTHTKKEHTYPIASSEVRASHKKPKVRNKKRSTRNSKSK